VLRSKAIDLRKEAFLATLASLGARMCCSVIWERRAGMMQHPAQCAGGAKAGDLPRSAARVTRGVLGIAPCMGRYLAPLWLRCDGSDALADREERARSKIVEMATRKYVEEAAI
jgi:hypothetical protein